MFAPKSNWEVPELFPNIPETKTIAVDLETCDPNLLVKGPGWATGDGYVIGVGVATDDWKGYFPFRHQGGGNLDEGLVLKWLSKTLSSNKRDVVFHNLSLIHI